MNRTKKNAVMTAIGCALIMFANGGMTNTFALNLPEFVAAFNESAATIAIAVTVGTLFSFVLSLVGGKIIQKLTPRVTLFIASICTFAYGLMHYLAPNVTWLYIAGMLSGFVLALVCMLVSPAFWLVMLDTSEIRFPAHWLWCLQSLPWEARSISS